MKKLILLLPVVSLTILLIGCHDSGNENGYDTGNNEGEISQDAQANNPDSDSKGDKEKATISEKEAENILREYLASANILKLVAFPVVFAAINRSLLNGISFAMCFISMTAGYTFSISEKNGMERLYGILPVSKKHMVIGRYLYTCTVGLLTLMISLIVYPIVLYALGVAVSSIDIMASAITGIILFSLYTVFLLPGYYKFGAIKGRLFMFVPVAGYLVVLMFASKFDFAGGSVLSSVISSPMILVIVVLMICIMAFLLSAIVSIRILQNKEV